LSFLESPCPLLREFLDKKRRVREFWVITGTTARTIQVDLAAQSSATVVVLMGMSKLNENVLFFKRGQRRDNPLRLFKTEPLQRKK
jgi:uroporphyrin-III C-methyltransferase